MLRPGCLFRWDLGKVRTIARFAALHWRKPVNAEQAGDQLVRLFQLLGSTGYPHDREWIRGVGRRGFEHRTNLAGGLRQARATRVSGDRRAELAGVRAPTLVISGEAEPVQPVRAGKATAAAIPGARFVSYPGMGHDLPRELWPSFIDEIESLRE